MVRLKQDSFQGLELVSLENDSISISVLPQIGGKIISLKSKKVGKEFIFLGNRKFQRPVYGMKYEKLDISGFDECFPTIAGCSYPEWPWKGTIIPDHGELFTLPWECKTSKNSLVMTVYGIRFPYKFCKIIFLEKNVVKISYELENLSPYDFKYIWAAHPLFSVSPGTIILLPKKVRIRTIYSKYERLVKSLHETLWPITKQTNGEKIDLSIVRSNKEDAVTKIFTTKLKEGWCGLRYPENVILKMVFPVEQIPYIGIWINEGGWPFKGEKSYNVAIEPCTNCQDKVKTAIQSNECAIINGRKKNFWYLHIIVEDTKQKS
jgi:hypothetical protein